MARLTMGWPSSALNEFQADWAVPESWEASWLGS